MIKIVTRLVSLIAALSLGIPSPAAAQTSPDSPAAIVIFPHLQRNAAEGIDTVVQLGNVSPTNLVRVSCFYLAADRACSPTSFEVNLTRKQPLTWRIGDGLAEFPLAGGDGSVPGQEQGNDGSLIPPVPSDPFEGSLLCMTQDANGIPVPTDFLIGSATIESFQDGKLDAAAYNAIGIRSRPDAQVRGDALVLGGASGGYQACSRLLEAVHYLDGALDAPTKASRVATRFAILPCTLDLSYPAEQVLSLQYEVVNEFEERLAVRREQVGCEQQGFLSSIDASSPERSIFNAAVGGTLTARTRIYANDGSVGLIAVALETHTGVDDPANVQTTAFNVGTLGTRSEADVITLPGLANYPQCGGDCDWNGGVTVDEVQMCVSLALGDGTEGCRPCDDDRDGSVSVNELVGSVDHALNGCGVPTR